MLIEVDKSILEDLKRNIIDYLISIGVIKNQLDVNLLFANMNKVKKLYVQTDLRTMHHAKMRSYVDHIVVDSEFAHLDSTGTKFMGWKSSYRDIILSQLGHELLHNASRYGGHSGICKEKYHTAFNEGITQMYSEDIYGVVVSKYTDGYSNNKKMAKVFRSTFGDYVICDSYFKHKDTLKRVCNRFTGDDNYFDRFCARLNSVKELRILFRDEDISSKNAILKICRDKIDLLYMDLILNIIIPKMNSLNRIDRKKYIIDVLDSFKDDSRLYKYVVGYIEKAMYYDNNELELEKRKVSLAFDSQHEIEDFIKNLVNKNRKIDSNILVRQDGSILINKDGNMKVITNPNLCSIIYNRLFDMNIHGINDEEINTLVHRVSRKEEITFKSGLSVLDKRCNFIGIKNIMNRNGYKILNNYNEFDSSDSISIDYLEKNRILDFDDLKMLLDRYDLKGDRVIDRRGKYIVNDSSIIKNVRFAYLWLSCAGVKWFAGEVHSGALYAFNSSAERLYNKIMRVMTDEMKNTGNLNIDDIMSLDLSDYKHNMEIISNLFKNPESYEWVYEYVQNIVLDPALQFSKEKSLLEEMYSEYDRYSVREDSERIAKINGRSS